MAVVFSVAALEAFINEVGEIPLAFPEWSKEEYPISAIAYADTMAELSKTASIPLKFMLARFLFKPCDSPPSLAFCNLESFKY